MSNEPIPSPPYSSNRTRAILATQTVEVGSPERLSLGLVRPGCNEAARSERRLTDDQWHHVAVTIDQDSAGTVTGRQFIDGKPAGARRTSQKRIVSIEELECYVYVRQ